MIEIFPIKIWKGSLKPSQDQYNKTIQELKKYFNSCNKNFWTGESGYSTGEIDLNLHQHIDLSWLFNGIYPDLISYWEQLNYMNMNIILDSCWANLHLHGDETREHSHNDGFYGANIISGVYYLKKPVNDANIKFCNPLDYIIRMTPYKNMKGIDTISEEIVSSQYDYILFPSWLRHRVENQVSKEERIAISFNYRGYI